MVMYPRDEGMKYEYHFCELNPKQKGCKPGSRPECKDKKAGWIARISNRERRSKVWTILSGIFGGLLRLAPEIFKMINAKAEMKHELDMQKVAYDFQVLKGNQRIDEIQEQGGLIGIKAVWMR